MKVLIIEDDHDHSKIMKKIFIKAGHEVETAFAGYEVKNMVKSSYAPDAIVMDLHIPEMDGQELLSNITSKWRDVNIYIYSGYEYTLPTSKNVRGCFRKGVNTVQEIIKAMDGIKSEFRSGITKGGK